uniref:Uncharacterized protein n=1 Tax=Trichogramma kaykai TaxID=54128 RepID=A0ABD2WDG7_9HYME
MRSSERVSRAALPPAIGKPVQCHPHNGAKVRSRVLSFGALLFKTYAAQSLVLCHFSLSMHCVYVHTGRK